MPSKRSSTPDSAFPDEGLHKQGNRIWAPLRGWVNVQHKPEEVVRQLWVRTLHLSGQYALDQMDQERRTHHGRRSPRADIIVWHSAADKQAGREPILVVETKADEGAVRPADFWQGESYARAAGARFLVLANASSHVVFELTKGIPGRARQINDWPKAADIADPSRLNKLVNRLEVFDREQFQRVLFECHTLLRDNHAMTPDRAFDTISKVLFIKLHVERTQTHDTFTTKYLEEAAKFFTNPNVAVHEQMFDQTKAGYSADDLFDDNDRLDISADTFRELVGKLERFNLSKTGEDIKGIAFERFLGRTFRGELGQYFTPRPVVDFMVNVLNPQEGEVICDPAAGSGGFLIRVFDHVRDQISADIALKRENTIETITAEYPDDADDATLDARDQRIAKAVEKLNEQLAPSDPRTGGPTTTRVGVLAWQCIYGTDKEPRAARTAKMNMIMHGDGHGGIHWHDGLVDTNGIFEGRFRVVITNPPFGATVTSAQRIGATPETDVPNDPSYRSRQESRYGNNWLDAHNRVVDSRGKKILDLFEIGAVADSRRTEQMFLERCLRLLEPGGRLGIVLPNGNLNASSQAWLRRWAEGKAFIRAVVALPPETFKFSGASVTASVVFMQKFREDDSKLWEKCWAEALEETEADFAPRRDAVIDEAMPALLHGGDAELRKLLAQLAALGVSRTLPKPTREPEEGLVRTAPSTKIRGLIWQGSSSTTVQELKKEYIQQAAGKPELKQALKLTRVALKSLDEQQSTAMWKHVRKAFDYPVFMATPKTVGITATGETGGKVRNDLPAVLTAWRQFKTDHLSEVLA